MTTRLSAIAFTSDIARLTENFTGRQWVFDDIDRWLKESEERFFILTGEPGVGKSAIAARLTQIRDDVAAYHFCRANDVETVRPARILRSLAAQLGEHLTDYGQALANTIKPIHLRVEVNITIGSMTGSQVTGVYIENLKESDPENELDILIRAPLEELQKMYAERQQAQPTLAIILIDSLDEAVTTTGTNLVKLLTQLSKSISLPSWVRFIMTSRPERRVLRGFEPLKPHHLQEESDASLADVRQYIEDRVDQPALQDQLQVNQIQPQTLINEITNLSRGNFLYTTLLLNDIEAGRQALDNLAALPKSIDDIYHGFLSRFSEEDWSDRYKPIFGVLTVAQEPVSEKQISNFTNVDPEDIRDNIRIARQFFSVDLNVESQEVYSLFHQSLRDYLLNKERNLDFWINAKKQHLCVAKYYYLVEYVWSEVNFQAIDSYGFRHLSFHLLKAERKEELYRLLTASPSWMIAKSANCIGDAAYVEDLELAIDDFTISPEPSELLTLIELHTARQIVNQRLSRHRDAGLQALIWLEKEAEALNHARLRFNLQEKWDGLLSIYIASRERGKISFSLPDEMLTTAYTIEDEEKRLKALSTVSIVLAQVDRVQDALEIATSIEDHLQKACTFSQIITVLIQNKQLQKAEEICKYTLELVLSSEDDWRQRKLGILIEIAMILVQLGRTKQALETANFVQEKVEKEWILGSISTALAHQEEVSEALEIADSIENIPRRLRAFCLIVTTLAKKNKLRTAQKIYSEKLKNVLLLSIDDGFTETYRVLAVALANIKLFHEAVEVINSIKEMGSSSIASNEVVRVLVEAEEFQLALELAYSIEAGGNRTDALSEIAIALAQSGKIERSLEIAYSIRTNEKQRDTLSKISIILAKAGDVETAESIYLKSLEVNYPLEFHGAEIAVLSQVAQVFSKANELQIALAIVDTIQNNLSLINDFWLAQILPTSIVQILVKAEQSEKATKICYKFLEQAQSLSNNLSQLEVLSAITHAFAVVKQMEVALEVFRSIEAITEGFQKTTGNSDHIGAIQAKCKKIQAEALGAITNALVQDEQASYALEIANSIEDQEVWLLVLCSIAKSLYQVDKHQEAEQVLDKVLEAVLPKEENQTSEVISELIITLLQTGQLRKAKQIIEFRSEDRMQREISVEFATQLVEDSQLQEALQIADSIENAWEKADVLCAISKKLSQLGKKELARDICAEALKNHQLIEESMRQISSGTIAYTFAQTKSFKEALAVLELRSLESFLSVIADWDSAFEEVCEGMSSIILRSVIRISGWVNPSWHKIYGIFNSPTDP
jgi:tetratricopeptide (TPR) repeat protein